MKNSERPAWMTPSRQRAVPQREAPPKLPVRLKQPAHTLQLGAPQMIKSEVRKGTRGSSRGYNPYDTVTTRQPDVWHSKPKRA